MKTITEYWVHQVSPNLWVAAFVQDSSDEYKLPHTSARTEEGAEQNLLNSINRLRSHTTVLGPIITRVPFDSAKHVIPEEPVKQVTEYWVRQVQGGVGKWEAAFVVTEGFNDFPSVRASDAADAESKLLSIAAEWRETDVRFPDCVVPSAALTKVDFDEKKHVVPEFSADIDDRSQAYRDEQPPEGMGKSTDNLQDEPHHLESSFLPHEEDPTPTGATKPNRFGLDIDAPAEADVEEGTVVSVVLNVENPAEADIVVTWRKDRTTSTLHTEQPLQQQDAMEVAQLVAHAIKQDREIRRPPIKYGGPIDSSCMRRGVWGANPEGE